MKIKHLTLALLLLLIGVACQQQAQAQVTPPPNRRNPPPTANVMPDLVVLGITYEAGNKIRVRVMNQGQGPAGACSVALMKLAGGGPGSAAQKTWTMNVPALDGGKGFSNTISIGPETYSDAAFKARVDNVNAVKETNEGNNEMFDNSKVVK